MPNRQIRDRRYFPCDHVRQAVQRLSGSGDVLPLIITNSDFRFIVTEQMAETRVDAGAILGRRQDISIDDAVVEHSDNLSVVMIEMQTGANPGQDDIMRHEDVHARS